MQSRMRIVLLAGVGLLSALLFVAVFTGESWAQGNLNPITRPKVAPQIQPNKIASAYTYAKKLLTISSVDFLSSANNPGYTNSGEAVLAISADDVVDFSPDLTPDLTIYATNYPTPFKKMPQTRDMAFTNTQLYEYSTGTAQTVEGSRVYATYDKQMQTIKLKLLQTYYQIDARSTSGNRGVSFGVFCIHVNLIDDARKIWYHGKAVVRLYMTDREEVKKGG